MHTYPVPVNEEARLRELYSYNILDSEEEQDFTDIVELASYICNAPISLISLIDRRRQWFKAKVGISDTEMDREIAICAYTIAGKGPFIIRDATKDERFAGFSTVTGDPHVRFYAGFPLVSPSGLSVGTLCVIDDKARVLDPNQEKALNTLATQVVKLLEERANAMRHKERARLEKIQNKSLDRLMQTQRRILTILGHDARAPLYAINTMLRYTAKGKVPPEELESNLELITNQLGATLVMIEDLLCWGKGHLENQSARQEDLPKIQGVVEDVLAGLYANAHLKGVSLVNKVDSQLDSPVPATMLSFIIRNLLNNAIKFTADGSITVTAMEEEEVVILTVTDTGKGMDQDQVQHLNNRFINQDVNGVEADSGIGIMMIQEFLLQLGGRIRFASKKDSGTQVTVHLPKPRVQQRLAEKSESRFIL